MEKERLLKSLDFGQVDAESENNLTDLFVKTREFERVPDSDTQLIKGAKGSGKSAIFKLFTEHEDYAREKLPNKFPENLSIIKATGGESFKTVLGEDLKNLVEEDGFDYDKFWRLYISLKIASQIGSEGYSATDELGTVLQKLGEQPDHRVLPFGKRMWQAFIGSPPTNGNISIKDLTINFEHESDIDIRQLLLQEQEFLEERNKQVWLLFDQIDELQSQHPEKRKEMLEALFRTQLSFMRDPFSNIHLKVLIRSDIWKDLSFVNMDKFLGKQINLGWNSGILIKLINKRMLSSPEVKEYVSDTISKDLDADIVDQYDIETQKRIFYAVFADQVYSGPKEADLFDWIRDRIKDGLDGHYPRELISFCNVAKENQIKENPNPNKKLIEGNSVKDAYYTVSEQRVNTYLGEFGEIEEHVNSFEGMRQKEFTRDELSELFEDLSPYGDEAITKLYELGVLKPKDGRGRNADKFEIPPLYRDGLGLVLRGRP
ncbi:hypothetical protein NDI56_14190 [Haloarcula sp. S1CR25-12]|uniref:Uncharacterized protein n=1 Tax=Haloarcula saliterrae TaxID=2950534 RepID=A0ABU2FE66_9EURY|nr:hypothetical protein [Haloarcula sp. S1CR25-12]MDS0260552.1 hypothetical protein [Haloarcula sp. S1CR25-12]